MPLPSCASGPCALDIPVQHGLHEVPRVSKPSAPQPSRFGSSGHGRDQHLHWSRISGITEMPVILHQQPHVHKPLPALCCPTLAVMEIDAIGTFTMSQAAFPLLKQSDAACITNISATLQYGATWWQVSRAPGGGLLCPVRKPCALDRQPDPYHAPSPCTLTHKHAHDHPHTRARCAPTGPCVRRQVGRGQPDPQLGPGVGGVWHKSEWRSTGTH